MIRHTFFAVTIGLLIFFLYLLQYTGAFKSVAIGTENKGPYTLVFKEHRGPYHKIAEHISEVEKWAQQNDLRCRYTFGEYFDDPATTDEGRLHSRGGCLLEPADVSDLKTLEALTLPHGILKAPYAQTRAVVALFSGSPGIGPYKVYPKAREFMARENLKPKGAVIEIYEVLGAREMNTTYLWPVD